MAERCIFMGCSKNSKAYRIYNFKTQDIAVRRGVIFLKEGQVTPEEEYLTQEAPFEMVVQNKMQIAEQQVVDGAR